MKKIMMAIAATFVLSTAAMAQNDETKKKDERRPDPQEMVQQQTNRMAERYALTAEQTEQVQALNTEYAGKLRPMGGPGRGPRPQAVPRDAQKKVDGETGATATRPSREEMEARMKEMKANQEAYNAKLKEIMTDEQYAQYETDMKQMRERGPRQGGGRGQRHNRQSQE